MQLLRLASLLCIPCVLISARPLPRIPTATDGDKWRPNRDLKVSILGRVIQVGTFYNRVMGQCSSTEPYLQMLQHLLRIHGVKVNVSDLMKCVQLVHEYNPWFPEEGTVDPEVWLRARSNVEKAWRQGERIPIRFWSVWMVIYALLRSVDGQTTFPNIQKVSEPVLQELTLDQNVKKQIQEDIKENIYDEIAPEPQVQPSAPEAAVPVDSAKSKVKSSAPAASKTLQALSHTVHDIAQQLADLKMLTKSTAPKRRALPVIQDEGDFDDYEISDDDDLPLQFAFPIVRPLPVGGQMQPARWEGIDIDHIGRLKKAVTLYGPQSPYVKNILHGVAQHYGNFAPYDWKQIAHSLLKEAEYLQWNMWYSDLAAKKAQENANSNNPIIRQITYPMLTGTGQFEEVAIQAQQSPQEIHDQLSEIALEAWDRIRPVGEHYGSWTKIIQKPNEPYVEFLARLRTVLDRTVVGEQAREQLLKMLAFENANEDCRRALLPIRESNDVNLYLKACKDIGSDTRKMQMFAETMMTTWQALNKKGPLKCFGCGKEGHMKRDCRKSVPPANNIRKTPGICPKCKKGKHWARECRSKVVVADQLSGNDQRGHLRGPEQKTEGAFLPYPMLPNTAQH